MLPNLKIDQIAFLARTDEDEHLIKYRLGLLDAEWIEDVVKAEGLVDGDWNTNVAKLLFNEDYGIQVEILRYLNGANYTQNLKAGEICHIGMHVSSEDSAFVPPFFNSKVAQEVETISHTNEFLTTIGRRYHYTVYDTRKLFGVHFKIIQRIEDSITIRPQPRVLKDDPQA